MQFLLLTTNRFGVLSRITSIVSSFGLNIESASVYPAGDSGNSVICLTLDTTESIRLRVHRKLSRLVDVLEISSGLESEVTLSHPEQSTAAALQAKAGLT